MHLGFDFLTLELNCPLHPLSFVLYCLIFSYNLLIVVEMHPVFTFEVTELIEILFDLINLSNLIVT